MSDTGPDIAQDTTQSYYDAIAAMHSGPNAGSDLIDTIKNFAQATDDPNVYTLAEIPPPAPPAPSTRSNAATTAGRSTTWTPPGRKPSPTPPSSRAAVP
ncbi:MAG: hypothetical protein Q9O74_05130 [Planctomycetota bacterium]|nr:hypothetical protein [Planctomycetota bacterium]